jgi:hypothetical protein
MLGMTNTIGKRKRTCFEMWQRLDECKMREGVEKQEETAAA